MSLHARQQLQHLAEIGTLLARFESIDGSLPAILSLMTRTLRVRGATLISNRSGRILATGWTTEDTSPTRLRLDEAHARVAYGYLTDGTTSGARPATGQARANASSALSAADLRAGMAETETHDFVVLPLVVQGGRAFGVFQVEGDMRFDESDLVFVNAVALLLAVAIDRQAVRASKDAIIKAIRVHDAERIAELQRSERAQHFLADVSSVLADSLEDLRALTSVVRASVPFLADVCFVDEISEKGTVVRIDASGVGEPLGLTAPKPRRRPQDEVLATGLPIMLPGPSGASADGDEEHVRCMNEAGFESMIVVPLIAGGETLGALTLAVRKRMRRYGDHDLALAQELARRLAMALHRARLQRQIERAIQARDDILDVVSHDLRSPLNTLRVSASLLSEELPEHGSTATSAKALEMIGRSINRMERMVGDLLDAASIESGRLAVTKEDQLLQTLIEEAIEDGKPAASKRALRLEAHLPEQEMCIPCDRGRIVQVLSNLISNAIKFTPRGGSIVVSAELYQEEARVAVNDTGAGIDRAELPFVFDRYFRAKTVRVTGTGLGLCISKGIIEGHGGVLWAESEPDKGSTFFFTLPRG